MAYNPDSITDLCISIAEGQLSDLDHMWNTIYYWSYADDEQMSEEDILEMLDFYRQKQRDLIAAFKSHGGESGSTDATGVDRS